jgi:hypothetical protein
MSISMWRFREARSQCAGASRARLAVTVLLSASACSSSTPNPGPTPGPGPGTTTTDGGSPATDSTPPNNTGAGSLVTVVPNGPGRITSTPAGIDCGGGGTACSAAFAEPSVTLATDDATTVRWSGDCSGNGSCAVALGADRTITAETFAPLRLTFDDPDHLADSCNAIAAGPGDAILVTGQYGNIAQGHDAWTRAYDATGAVLWTYHLSTPSEGHDLGAGLVALPGGGAAVAGTWFSGSDSHWNGFVLDLGATGASAWSDLSEEVGDDMNFAIARDAAGGLYVAGSQTDGSASLRALSPDGRSEAWSVSRSGTGAGHAAATGVAVDPLGYVTAVGSETNADTGVDGWLASYDASGALRWSLPVASAGTDSVRGVAAGADTIAAIGSIDGASTIRVYTGAGAPRWDITAADGTSWGGIALDATGNVAVTGSVGTDLIVRKYTAGGDLIWERTVADAHGAAAAFDSHGDLLICGQATLSGNTDGLVMAFAQ